MNKKETVTLDKEVYDQLMEMLENDIHESQKICEECRHKNRDIYDNLPFEDIDRYVREDLTRFDQDNPAPLSLTVLFESEDGKHNMFRHYELGPIMGFIVVGYIPQDEEHCVSAMISEIHEDDEYWFAPNTPMQMSMAWTYGAIKTLIRMEKWCDEHFFEGFVNGKWISRIDKDIVPEEVYREDGESACPLFGGPEHA